MKYFYSFAPFLIVAAMVIFVVNIVASQIKPKPVQYTDTIECLSEQKVIYRAEGVHVISSRGTQFVYYPDGKMERVSGTCVIR